MLAQPTPRPASLTVRRGADHAAGARLERNRALLGIVAHLLGDLSDLFEVELVAVEGTASFEIGHVVVNRVDAADSKRWRVHELSILLFWGIGLDARVRRSERRALFAGFFRFQ